MNRINILCTTDDNYVPYLGIMLTSLYENNRCSKVVTYIMTAGLNRHNKTKLDSLAERYDANIEFITMDDDALQHCPIWPGDHVSIAAYYRILAAELLPSDIDKVLYLDCDIIVNRPLDDLFNTNLSDYSAGAVIDDGYFNMERNEFLKIETPTQYFNTGVLLINLEYWRTNEVASKCLKFIKKNGDNLHSHDQDTLNFILKDTVCYLPIIYNFQDFYLFKKYFDNYEQWLKQEIISTEKNSIAIIHLCMPVKPLSCWHCVYPFDDIWRHYKKISLWRHYRRRQPVRDRLACFSSKICWKLKIKRPISDFIEIR